MYKAIISSATWKSIGMLLILFFQACVEKPGPLPVETSDVPDILELDSQGTSQQQSESLLEKTRWNVTLLNLEPLVEETRITLNFNNGTISGNAGCNSYRPISIGEGNLPETYEISSDGSIRIPNFLITEMDCPTPEGRMEQEAGFVKALKATRTFEIKENQLFFYDAQGVQILVFSKTNP